MLPIEMVLKINQYSELKRTLSIQNSKAIVTSRGRTGIEIGSASLSEYIASGQLVIEKEVLNLVRFALSIFCKPNSHSA